MFCRECGVSIDDNSKFCRECGARQSEVADQPEAAQPVFEEAVSPPKSGFPMWGKIGLGIVFLAIVLMLIAPKQSPMPSSSDAAINADLNAAANDAIADVNAATSGASGSATSAASENWSYSTDTDKVRGGSTYFASTTSTNTIHQNAPYDGDTSMTMTVRHSPSASLDIILRISSGQMMCPSFEGCSGTVRFDDGSAQRINFNGPADEDSETIFVSNARSFLAKLRKAKRVVIEKTLYEAGAPQFEFDVHGLKWSH